jgi:prepilin-type N-terminal cleavage/methylation domain-containing protein/prepilin-type processing-associated H-X9-DG protein
MNHDVGRSSFGRRPAMFISSEDRLMRHRSTRRGFTLIELLIVMAIIATLIALLLPAVQKVREAAYKTRCANNLHNIGLAVQGYVSTTNILPSGGMPNATQNPLATRYPANPPANAAPITGFAQNWSWAYQLLPYLDQQNLWATPLGPESAILSMPLSVFVCTSRRDATVLNGQFLIDYAGNGGVLNPPSNPPTPFPNGAIVPNIGGTPVRVTSIPRGQSNLLIVAEKYVQLGTTGAIGDDVSGYYAFNTVVNGSPDYSNVRFGDAGPYQDNAGQTSQALGFPFGSSHVAGMNALFGDGSVRTIRYNNNTILPIVSNRLNQTPVNSDDL